MRFYKKADAQVHLFIYAVKYANPLDDINSRDDF